MRSESGQGLLEYILLLVIILVLILGLAHQFNTAFRTWAQGFFDGYIACLLETGDLPGVSEQCREEWAKFDLDSGKRLVDGSLGGEGAGGQGAGNSQNRNAAGAGGGGEVLASGSGSGRVGFARLGDRGRPATVRESSGGNDGDKGSKSNFGMNNTQVGRVGRNNTRRETVTMTFSMDAEEEKNKRTKPTAAKAGKVDEGGGDALRPGRAIEKSQTERAVGSLSEETSFSFGALIRWLVIICIVIAMIVFFGGQLLQISKSREKGGD